MDWNELSNIILVSIQIVAVFIAIIIGLIITKVMELKKEKNEAVETIEDINSELSSMNDRFNKLKIDNYNFYKEDNIFEVIDNIYDSDKFTALNNNPYVTEKEEKEYYIYVKNYIKKVIDFVKKEVYLEDCKKQLKVKNGSIEETIIDIVYDRSGY